MGVIKFLAVTVLTYMFSLSDAGAKPVMWFLVGVTFKSGATATGSFTFDADAQNPATKMPGIFTTWNIVVANESVTNCAGTGGVGSDCVFSPTTNVSPI